MTYGFEITLSALTAMVTAITHLANNSGLPTKWCPWLALALGVIGTVTLSGLYFSPEIIFSGLAVGLASYGLWNGALDATGKQA